MKLQVVVAELFDGKFVLCFVEVEIQEPATFYPTLKTQSCKMEEISPHLYHMVCILSLGSLSVFLVLYLLCQLGFIALCKNRFNSVQFYSSEARYKLDLFMGFAKNRLACKSG